MLSSVEHEFFYNLGAILDDMSVALTAKYKVVQITKPLVRNRKTFIILTIPKYLIHTHNMGSQRYDHARR